MRKRHSVFGDSISSFRGLTPEENVWYYDRDDTNGTGVTRPEETWWAQAIADDGGELLANAAFSGSMVEGVGFPAGQSHARIQQIIGEDGQLPDVVWVFYGINDYGWGGAEAQLHGHAHNAPRNVDVTQYAFREPENAPADAVERFEAAYSEMLRGLKEVAPDAQIRCMTLLPGRVCGQRQNTFCYFLRGIDIDAYNDAIRHAAASVGAEVVDIRAQGKDYSSSDGTHPDKEGMAQIAALIRAARNGMTAAIDARTSGDRDGKVSGDTGADASCGRFASPDNGPARGDYPTWLVSQRTCDKATCVGCPHAKGTGIQWSCVCEKLMV